MREASITNLRDTTSVDGETGAVRSIQTADLLLSEERLTEIWSPVYLERLARTYWRFLTRVTLGLVRVRYTERERFVVLLFGPLKLLTFKAPEYLLEPDHGMVRWRIERGLLVARAGRDGDGHLQIDVRRLPSPAPRARDCTSRSRSPTSTPRSHSGSAAGSTTSRSRASTCSSRTGSCARSRAWTWRRRARGALRSPRRDRGAAAAEDARGALGARARGAGVPLGAR